MSKYFCSKKLHSHPYHLLTLYVKNRIEKIGKIIEQNYVNRNVSHYFVSLVFLDLIVISANKLIFSRTNASRNAQKKERN
jgi:hypothetical protein